MAIASRARRGSVLRGLGGFLILVALGTLAWLLRDRLTARASVPAAADSTVVAAAESAAADSAAAPKAKRGFFAFARRGGDQETKRPDPVPVELAVVERRDVPSFFSGTATIEAEQQADVLAKVAGTLQRLLVEEGDDVREGQVLLEIDASEPLARHEELRVRARSQERQFERVAALHAKGLASDRDYEDAKLQMETARAQLQVSDITLGWTKVRAPFSGRITRRLVNAGQNVVAGTHLVSIADFEPLLARVYMPERQVEAVRVGQEVRLAPDARPDESYDGQVTMIAPVVDTRSGTVKVTVALRGSPERLRPGSFVRALIKTDVHPGALVVPKQALVSEGGETFVYRAAADSVVKVRVETGYADERATEVVVGLAAGDRVVTVGQGGIRHGTRVRALEPAPADSSMARR